MIARLVLILATLLATASALAHEASTGYVTVTSDGGTVRAEIALALRDLDPVLDLDADGDGTIRWGELRARHADLAGYIGSGFAITRGGEACTLGAAEHLIDRRDDGAYAVVRFAATCAASGALGVDYRLLFEADRQHRALVRIDSASGVAAPGASIVSGSAAGGFFSFVAEGIHHIVIGADHLLFLVCLLLPALFAGPAPRRWQEQILPIVRIVTAFTLAHSITLALAALGLVQLPSRLVESAIAATVVIAAIANLRGGTRFTAWPFAFALGLVHGFGFASVLGELALPTQSLVTALAGFNLGVELGQLAFVALVVPLAWALSVAAPAWRGRVLRGGSIGIACIGAAWLAQRAFESGVGV